MAPGIYPVYPKVDTWEVPGPILTREQAVVAPEGKLRVARRQTIGIEMVQTTIQGRSPNPGWPLPGHVMTNPWTGPETDVWSRFRMDEYDW